jgi:hypothetical protein
MADATVAAFLFGNAALFPPNAAQQDRHRFLETDSVVCPLVAIKI